MRLTTTTAAEKSEGKTSVIPQTICRVKSAVLWDLSHVIAFYLPANFLPLFPNKLRINGLSSKIFTTIYFSLNQKMFFINFFSVFLLCAPRFSFDILSHLEISSSFVFPTLKVANVRKALVKRSEEGSNNKVRG